MLPGQCNPMSIVDAGAKAITKYYGGDDSWMEKIWFETLDLANGSKCVIGQVFGEYCNNIRKLFPERSDNSSPGYRAALHGFVELQFTHTCRDKVKEIFENYGVDTCYRYSLKAEDVYETNLSSFNVDCGCGWECDCPNCDEVHAVKWGEDHNEDCMNTYFQKDIKEVYDSCEGCNPPETLLETNQMYEQLTMLWIEYIDNYLVKKWLDSLPIEEWFYGTDLLPPHWKMQEVVPHVLVKERQLQDAD